MNCQVCGYPVMKNNEDQVVKYCSKECRLQRHNKKPEKE